MTDALLGLLRAQEGQERLALEVEVVLLGGHPGRALAAAEDGGDLGGHERVVLADLAPRLRVVDPHLEGGEGGRAQHGNVGARPARPVARAGQAQRHLLRVFDEAIGVRGEAVGGGQEVALRLEARGRYLREGDQLERPLDEGERVGAFDARATVVGPKRELLGAPSAGHHPHPHLDEAHVGLGRSLDPPRVQADLAAAAQGEAERRRHHRHLGVLQGHVRVLELADGETKLVPLPLLRGEKDEHEVGAHGEVRSLVADDEGVEARLRFLDRGLEHDEGVLPQRVHLGVELHEGTAVAQVQERRARVLLAQASLFLDRREVDHSYALGHGRYSHRAEHGFTGPVLFVERGATRGEEALHEGRHRQSGARGAFREGLHAHPVHEPEGAVAPSVAPFHGPVHRDDVVGNLGDAGRRVERRPAENAPQELRGLVGPGEDLREASAEVGRVRGGVYGGELGFLARAILEGLPVEGENVGADLLVEARARLLAQETLFHHLLHELGHREHLSLRVFGHGRVQVLRDLHAHVDPGDVCRPEGRASGPPDGGTGQEVDLLHREIELDHGPKRRPEAERPDPVGDEVGRVLAADDPFAQDAVGEGLDLGDHRGIGLWPRDGLEQPQVARGVEEVRAQEAAAEGFGQVRRHLRDAEARGIARDDRRRLDQGRHLGEELLLDLEVFDHRLEHPVGVLQLAGKVVLEVAGAQGPDVLGQVQGAGLELAQHLQPLARGRTPVRTRTRHVEKRHLQALGHHMGGHLCPHGARPQHDRLLDVGLHADPS